MVKRFLEYVEIKTKITSFFAFSVTLAFLFYIGRPIDPWRTAVFFAAMFVFDLTTTAINNYIDTKTNEQVLQFKRRTAFLIILVLFAISTAAGIYLVFLTDLVVLAVGALCFVCGILYTGGPVPVSRLPLGELLSGVFYGLFIPFLILYINLPKGTFFDLDFTARSIGVTLNVRPVLALLLLSIPPVCTTANIMLANNICDMEKDVAANRFTLPYFLGVKTSLYLFAGIYYLAYAAVAAMVALGFLSPFCLLFLLTLIVVQKNINVFFGEQDKATTFLVSIKNYIVIMGAITVLVFISRWFGAGALMR